MSESDVCATLAHYKQSSCASLNINIFSSVDVKVIVKCDGRTIIIISMSVILVDIIIFDEPDLRVS